MRLSYNAKLLFAGIFILVVMMRTGGAHLHYCFDGSEPPVSVHWQNDVDHHHVGHAADKPAVASQVEHSDVDVLLSDDAPIKKSTPDLDLIALVLALPILFALLSIIRSYASDFRSQVPSGAQRVFDRPPLRGPPLTRR
jgi:hypothetical protein